MLIHAGRIRALLATQVCLLLKKAFCKLLYALLAQKKKYCSQEGTIEVTGTL